MVKNNAIKKLNVDSSPWELQQYVDQQIMVLDYCFLVSIWPIVEENNLAVSINLSYYILSIWDALLLIWVVTLIMW